MIRSSCKTTTLMNTRLAASQAINKTRKVKFRQKQNIKIMINSFRILHNQSAANFQGSNLVLMSSKNYNKNLANWNKTVQHVQRKKVQKVRYQLHHF